MALSGSSRLARVECFSYQCKRWYSQIYGINLMNDVAGGRRDKILGHGRTSEQFAATRFFAAPVQAKPKPEAKDTRGPRLNKAITSEFVRLVTDEGHSVVSRREALDHAMKLKLDLVEVQRHAKPPVCKIMDFHREMYKQQLKEKDRLKSKSALTLRKGVCKEVRFTGKTEQKDLQIKADMVKRLMDRGYRVKLHGSANVHEHSDPTDSTARQNGCFKNISLRKAPLAFVLLDLAAKSSGSRACFPLVLSFVQCMAMGTEEEDLGGLLSHLSALIEDVAFVESGPRVEKRQAYVVVRHIKFGSKKKSPVKKAAKIVVAPSTVLQDTATSPPMFDSTGPVQIPLQVEEEWEHIESGEEEILSDEEADSLGCSETPITTPVEDTEEESGLKMTTWSAVDAGDEFEKLFGFDGNSSSITPREDTADVTIELSEKLPFTSVATGPDINQGWSPQRNTVAGSSGLKLMPDAVKAKLGSGNELKGIELTPGKIPLNLGNSHANENQYSRSGLNATVRQMQSTDRSSRVPETKVLREVSESSSAVQRGQINSRGSVNNLPEHKNQSPNLRWQPRPPVNATPSTSQNPKSIDNSSLRNLKPPPSDERRKQPQADTKQGPSLSGYGIFSAPKNDASSDQKPSTVVNREKERNMMNPMKSPGSCGISSSANPSKSAAESPKQDADKTREGGWGIFSRETSRSDQHGNADSQTKEQI